MLNLAIDSVADTFEAINSYDFGSSFLKHETEMRQPRWTKFGDDLDVESSLGPYTSLPHTLPHTPSRLSLSPEVLEITSETKYQGSEDGDSIIGPGSTMSTSRLSSHSPPARRNNHLAVCIPKSTLSYPKSLFDGWTPPLPPVREREAVAALMDFAESQYDLTQEDFLEFELDNFSIYVRSKHYYNELRALQHLTTKTQDDYYFDGVLRLGDVKHYVQGVQFRELPIGNYGISNATVGDQIWIRSRMNESAEIYYRLNRPSVEYARFYSPFLWLADFAKHVVDFCAWMAEKNRPVTLQHFQKKFIERLLNVHKDAPSFQKWHSRHGSDDFRSALVTNVDFVWKELHGVGLKNMDLPVFKEIKLFTRYKPAPSLYRGEGIAPTIVTPYIHECFGHMKFGRLLQTIEPKEGKAAFEILKKGHESKVLPGEDVQQILSAENHQARYGTASGLSRKEMIASIKPGDTISTPPDSQGTGTKWKMETAKGFVNDNRWFGVVQKIHVSPRTRLRSFDVTWLYRPVDTPCCQMKYAWSKELFLSDHCTCEEGRNARWDEDEVLDKHDIDWFGNPETTAEFFVRQTYMVEDRRWVSLDPKHMKCHHDAPDMEMLGYQPGDTVLAAVSGNAEMELAEPYEVVEIFRQANSYLARLRTLRRRKAIDPQAKDIRPNELVYTEDFIIANVKNIVGRCLVRFFRPDEALPAPYDRDGTANVFFITHKLQLREEDGEKVCVPLEEKYPSMRQGFDPRRRGFQKLRGLDLFCGSGNFGRGLEEGGVVEMHWANDIWDRAIHTYMANTPANTRPFLGSVDDLLENALQGRYSASVPHPDEVDFIAGGSPCQGFSLLTDDKKCERQVKNQSLVASFASFVDFYRPKYGILENVPAIVQSAKNREEDVFSQLICAIVGMGYQAQIIMGDSWSYGAPQRRSRVFLYFAAPSYRLPEAPLPSHSHHVDARSRALGIMSNGEPYVRRSFNPTAFKFVSAAEGTADLPEIDDGKPDYCVGYPDHRLQGGLTPSLRFQFNAIPTHPYGMNFATAWKEGNGVMTASERELFPQHKCGRTAPNSKGWGRINPVDVFPTMTTRCGPSDSRTGRLLHWHQHRPITIMEARRAQGFLDHEVLLGALPEQWKLVGNSVARQMALALGLQFRKAWLGTLYDEPDIPLPTAQISQAPLKSVVIIEEETLIATEGWPESGGQVEENWRVAADSRPSTRESSNSIDELCSNPGFASTPPTSASESAETGRAVDKGGVRKRSLSLALTAVTHSAHKVQRLTQAQDGLLVSKLAATESSIRWFGSTADGSGIGEGDSKVPHGLAHDLRSDDAVDELFFEV